MTKGASGASVLFGVWLGCFTVAVAQLPPQIMVERYLLRADRLMADKDPKAALDLMKKIIGLQEEHGLTLPNRFHFRHAEVALTAGAFQDAMDAASKYLLAVERTDPRFGEALGLLDDAEQLQIWVGTRQTCTGQSKGAECWMEVSSRPECYVWNVELQPGETVTWNGQCSRGRAEGKGRLKQVWEDGYKISSTSGGSLQEGKNHGDWSEYLSDGSFQHGSYVEGRRHGSWSLLSADGKSQNGSYVEGKKHGRWSEHQMDGTSEEGPYVEGRRHGRWRERQSCGTSQEGSYVAGKRHGRWIVQGGNKGVREVIYTNGELVERE